jgi:hypothetical protein
MLPFPRSPHFEVLAYNFKGLIEAIINTDCRSKQAIMVDRPNKRFISMAGIPGQGTTLKSD